MKSLIAVLLLACVSVQPSLADTSGAPAQGSSVADTLKQEEHDFGDAMMALDLDRVNQIIADDFRGMGYAGSVYNKEGLLRDLKSDKARLRSVEYGPMDVKVMCENVAVVQARVREVRSMEGRDVNSSASFTDVFVKRGDKWMLVRTQTAKFK